MLEEFKKAKELIEKANSIYIVGHVNPDGDAIGSSFAMYLSLKKLGKNPTVIMQNYSDSFAFLPHLKETKKDTTRHAEILAIQKASKKLNAWRLEDCEMYVTLEPCSMCAGALIQSRIKKLYIGTMDYKTGACGSVFNLLEDYTFNHKVECETGILKEECEKILQDFFKELRKKKK